MNYPKHQQWFETLLASSAAAAEQDAHRIVLRDLSGSPLFSVENGGKIQLAFCDDSTTRTVTIHRIDDTHFKIGGTVYSWKEFAMRCRVLNIMYSAVNK